MTHSADCDAGREHVMSTYPGVLLPCWCEAGVYHCTPEDWEASRPEREAMQALMERYQLTLEDALASVTAPGHRYCQQHPEDACDECPTTPVRGQA